MKLYELIENADALEPNQYSFEQKLGWLSELDGQIYREVILAHESDSEDGGDSAGNAGVPDDNGAAPDTQGASEDSAEAFVPGFVPYPNGDSRPIVPFPYQSLYVHYLRAQIALNNGEAARANQYIAQYNAVFTQWQNAYNRTHMPRETGCFMI